MHDNWSNIEYFGVPAKRKVYKKNRVYWSTSVCLYVLQIFRRLNDHLHERIQLAADDNSR